MESLVAHFTYDRGFPVGRHVRPEGTLRTEDGTTNAADHLHILAAVLFVVVPIVGIEEHLGTAFSPTGNRSYSWNRSRSAEFVAGMFTQLKVSNFNGRCPKSLF